MVPIWLALIRTELAASRSMAVRTRSGLRHEQVVADDLNAVAGLVLEQGEPVPVLLVQSVLDGDDGVAVGPFHQQIHHLGGGELQAVLGQVVSAVPEEFGGREVQSEDDLLAGHVAGPLDRGHEQLQRLFVGLHRRGKAAFVADGGRPASSRR